MAKIGEVWAASFDSCKCGQQVVWAASFDNCKCGQQVWTTVLSIDIRCCRVSRDQKTIVFNFFFPTKPFVKWLLVDFMILFISSSVA